MAAELVEVELEQQALTWPDRAKAIAIKDQATHDMATGLLINITDLEREIIAHHKPIKDSAYAAHKTAVAAEKRLLDPLKEAKQILSLGITTWETEQKRIQAENQRKAEEEARRIEEEARLQLALQAEEMGASEETTKEILETPIPVERPVVPQTFQRTAGVSTRQTWKAEVTDLKALCRAVADGKASIEFIQPNMPALNGLARALKSTMQIPGVRAVPETGVSVRR